jgi:electron transfer flavoprotein beta subunit
MNIIVCYKWVLDAADLKVNPGLSVDFSRAKGKISEFDRNAIETAMRNTPVGDEVVALTYGNLAAQKSIKDVLSRGPARACWINDPGADTADGKRTAVALAAGIRKIGNFKLVLCAEGSEDNYAHEVGPRLGSLLGIPVVSNVIQLSIQGDSLQAIRKLQDSTETVQLTLPAVVTVLPEISEAPIPGLKMVLEASKKPVEQVTLVDLPDGLPEPSSSLVLLKGFQNTRKKVLYKQGTVQERIDALVASLKKEGVLA